MNYNSDEASIRETRTGGLRISKTLPYLNWHTKLALIDSLLDYSNEHRAWDYDELSYKHFLKIIRKYKPFSHKAEISEYEKIKAGDENAYNNFVLSNLRYVLAVARKHQNLGLPLNDLISEGIIGLCKAIKSWDETRGFRFITYAYHFIRAEMLLALSRDSLIHIPNNIFQSIEKVKRVQRKHYMENGCEIGFLELIEKLEIGANFLSPIMQAAEIKVLPLECIRAVSDSFDEFDTALTALTAGPIYSEYPVDEDLFQESLRISVEHVLREVLVSRRKQSIKIEPIPESTIRKATAQLRKGQRLFIRDYKNELKESNKNYKKLYDDEKRRIEFLMTLGYTKFLGDGNNLLDKLEDRFQRHQQKIEEHKKGNRRLRAQEEKRQKQELERERRKQEKEQRRQEREHQKQELERQRREQEKEQRRQEREHQKQELERQRRKREKERQEREHIKHEIEQQRRLQENEQQRKEDEFYHREQELKQQRREVIQQNNQLICRAYKIDSKDNKIAIYNKTGLFNYIVHREPHAPASKFKYLFDSTISILQCSAITDVLVAMQCKPDIFSLQDDKPVAYILEHSSELFDGNPNVKSIRNALKLFQAYMNYSSSAEG